MRLNRKKPRKQLRINRHKKEFYKAWHYLLNHKIFNDAFVDCLDIEVVKVNPVTNSVDNNFSKNTKVQVWLECGPWNKKCRMHDIDLDCGGDTFEDAIIKLAYLVRDKYK